MDDNRWLLTENIAERIKNCKSSRNGVWRNHAHLSDSEKNCPTLQEGEVLDETGRAGIIAGKFYDFFDITDISLIQAEALGQPVSCKVEMEISLLESAKDMEIHAAIVFEKINAIVAQFSSVSGSNTNTLKLDQTVNINDQLARQELAIVAVGTWTDAQNKKTELSIYRKLSDSNKKLVSYKHIHPRKITKPKPDVIGFIEDIEGVDLTREITGQQEDILIALIRKPDKLTDIDYLCGAGRGGPGNLPYLAVPGSGNVTMPEGFKIVQKPLITAMLKKRGEKQGGVAVVATNDANYSIKADLMTILVNENKFSYEFSSWGNQIFVDTGNWIKTKFDYWVEFAIECEGPNNSKPTITFVANCGLKKNSEPLAIDIMYGCVAPDTLVKMQDGTAKQIHNIQRGETVIGKNNIPMLVQKIWVGPEFDEMLEFQVESFNKPLRVTKQHPMWIYEKGWKRAATCEVGEYLQDEHGIQRRIVNIRSIAASKVVYNLELEPLGEGTENLDGSMICDGVVTGDNKVQNAELKEPIADAEESISDGNVYKIELDYVESSRNEDGTYNVLASWKTDESPQPFSGNYKVEVLRMGMPVASADTTSKQIELKNIKCQKDENYILKVSVANAPTVNAQALILLDTYENVNVKYDGRQIELSWDTTALTLGKGICIINCAKVGSFSYEIPSRRNGMKIPFEEEEYGAGEGFTVSLIPYMNSFTRGPESKEIYYYSPRYIPVKAADGTSQLRYVKTGIAETALRISLENTHFIKDFEEDIASGPLTITAGQLHELIINTQQALTRSEYLEFFKKLNNHVLPGTLYSIMDMVSRGALQNFGDMCFFQCGLDKENRLVDVRPGFWLGIEHEAYMIKDQVNGDDTAGFTGGYKVMYPITLANENQMEFLEFDSLITAMGEELYHLNNSDQKQIAGAGILELASNGMRQPFYQIYYPDKMYSSEVAPNLYAGNHIIMLARSMWSENPLPVNTVRCPGKKETDTITYPYLLFRGRSAISILMTIFVNGIERKFSVGMTLGKLLPLMGMTEKGIERIKVFRRNLFGDYSEVKFTGAAWTDMPLLNGDRIEG